MPIIAVIRTFADTVSNPDQLRQDIEAGAIVEFSDVGYTLAPKSAFVLAEEDDYDEDADMTSLRQKRTGIKNTIFVSTKGRGQHAAIKVAIDPPDSLNAAAAKASMRIHDFQVIGDYMSPAHSSNNSSSGSSATGKP
jgi:hypothetical protein